MKPYYIKDLRPDEGTRIEDRYLVKSTDIRDVSCSAYNVNTME